ncbi:MAG: S9 family peptidase, partial [Caulobacteraceae bacterium]
MIRLAVLLAAPAAVLLIAAGPPDWPNKEDIPTPGPVSVGLAGSEEIDVTRYFLANGPRRAALSPDGKAVAYTSNLTGEQQAWVIDTAGGAPRQLTFGLGVDGIIWTPDGDVLYGADKGGDERFGYFSVTPDGFKERVVVPQSDGFTYFGDFTTDGRAIYASTARNGRDFDLYSADLKGGGARLLVQGRLGLYPVAMQPNGDLMLAYESKSENAGEVSLIDLKTGRERAILKPDQPAQYDAFAWTPDGKGFYLVTDQDREFAALAYYDLAGGKLKIVEAPQSDVVSVTLSHDGHYLVWVTDEGGFHTLHGRDIRTGKPLAIPKFQPGAYAIEFARKAPVLGIHVSGPATPAELWTWDLTTGKARLVVAPTAAGLDLARMAMPSVVRFKARDGTPLSGLLYRPANAKGPAPVFLRLHGGPTSHARASWRPEVQYLVARGYAVLDFNYRGSTGSGKTLASLNDKRLRVNELGDLIDAVGWIKTQPGLDGARVAVGGGSYGGYLTNAVIGAY